MQKTLTFMKKSMTVFVLLALAVSSLSISSFASMAQAGGVSITTNSATALTTTNATMNATNEVYAASGHSFWASLSTFSTASTTLPAGVFSTPDLGAINANTTFSAPLSSVSGLPAITPGTTYYFAAWSNVAGTWNPGSVLTFTTPLLGTLTAEDFGVMDVSGVKGYTAGFGLTDATLTGATSVVTQLFSGTTLLQTDTLNGPNAPLITGVQISSPFDVFGSFNYVTDGYWTNVRESEYGQTLIPTRVVATVTLANGKIVTAENTNLTGDPATIFPAPVVVNITTNPATTVTTTDATLHGLNGNSAAVGHSFWVSLSPFVTTSPTIPAGVYSTADFGAIAANTAFSASLLSLTTTGVPTNLGAITPGTTYYFAD